MNQIAAREGAGIVGYEWPKPSKSGSTEYMKKWSYISLVRKWNWVIGSGVYVDDIDAAVAAKQKEVTERITELTTSLIYITLTILIITTIVSLLFSNFANKRIGMLVSRMREISRGESDLTASLNITGKDEVAEMAGY